MPNFQQPLLQSSVSHEPSEIILLCRFGAQETLSMLKRVVMLNAFDVENYDKLPIQINHHYLPLFKQQTKLYCEKIFLSHLYSYASGPIPFTSFLPSCESRCSLTRGELMTDHVLTRKYRD